MQGGVVFFRGTGSAARAYLEAEHRNADEYFLEGGTTQAFLRKFDGAGFAEEAVQFTGEQYQQWVDWTDHETGMSRGEPLFERRINEDGEIVKLPSSPRFAEMTVNCDKTLSVAAFLFEDVSAALDEAQNAAADAMSAYLAANSVTRAEAARVNGERRRRLVPVERFEEVRIRHETSRAGDPHRHLHVQWNTRVFAEGAWRGLWTGPTLNQQGALRGIGEAAISAHPGLRAALARNGLTFDAATGKVVELEAHAAVFSKRHAQIAGNLEALERAWIAEHGDVEVPREVRAKWQFQAWAEGRPQKIHAGGRPIDQWLAECEYHGLTITGFAGGVRGPVVDITELSPRAACEWAVGVLEGKQSAWSVADLTGQIALFAARHGVVGGRREIAAWAVRAAWAGVSQMPQLVSFGDHMPGWVRAYTSERVAAVERDLVRIFREKGLASVHVPTEGLSGQQEAARAIGGTAPLVVVEGAAGSGKTTMLRTAAEHVRREGRPVPAVVAPTRVAAGEAAAATGGQAWSVHKLLHEYGWRADEHGRWIARIPAGGTDPATGKTFTGAGEEFAILPGQRVVVDEAGMVSQDLMHALVQLAEEAGATLALVGDRAQLSAPGRGGVLHLAVNNHPSPLDMDELHRFRDPAYARLTLRMRERADDCLFDELHQNGNIVIHADVETAREAVAAESIRAARVGADVAVAADTNDAATLLNARIQEARAEAGYTRRARFEAVGSDGLTVRVGDQVMMRKNDNDLMVDNRQVWTVYQAAPDGGMTVERAGELRHLPREYVTEWTHLAYATTEHGVQGRSADFGHGIVTGETTASGLYVAATRGREANLIHVIADTVEDARDVFMQALQRERGDLGVSAARESAEKQLDGLAQERVLTQGELAGKLATAEVEHARLVPLLAEARARLRSAQEVYAALATHEQFETPGVVAGAKLSRAELDVRDLEWKVCAVTPEAVTAAYEASKQRLAAAEDRLDTAREHLSRIETISPAPGDFMAAHELRVAQQQVAAASAEVQAARTAVRGHVYPSPGRRQEREAPHQTPGL